MRLLEFWQVEKGILLSIQMLCGPQSGQSEPQYTIGLVFQGAEDGMEREEKKGEGERTLGSNNYYPWEEPILIPDSRQGEFLKSGQWRGATDTKFTE